MRILRIVAIGSVSGRYGGPFDTARRQARIARLSGHQCVLAYGIYPGDAPAGHGDLQVRLLGSSRSAVARLGLPKRGFLQLVRAIAAADVVHISFAREPLPLAAAALTLALRRRLVLQPHGMLTARTSWKHRVVDLIARPLVRRSISVIALTHVEQSELRTWLGRSTAHFMVLGNPLPNNVAELRAARADPSASEALFLARLHQRKNVGVFLEAAAQLESEGTPVTSTVIGPDGGELYKVLNAAQLHPSIRYEGTLPGTSVAARVAQAGVFVLTSSNEPWGNVLVSALALGVPVVVPQSAALADRILERQAGLVVNDGDSREFANAIQSIVGDETLAKALGSNGVSLAEEIAGDASMKLGLERAYGSGTKSDRGAS